MPDAHDNAGPAWPRRRARCRRRRALVRVRTTMLPWLVGWLWGTQRAGGALLRTGAVWVWVWGRGPGWWTGRVGAGSQPHPACAVRRWVRVC